MEWILHKKDGCPTETVAEARKAVPEEWEELFALQARVCAAMEDPEQFVPNQKQEMLENIQNQLTIGVWVEDMPIALAILRYDGMDRHNYAWYLDVPESDIPYWANADTVIVDPAWRGNQLQYRLLNLLMQWRRPDIIGMGCTVSPKNQFSLYNVQRSGFEIHSRRVMYGAHDRYLMRCPLPPLPGKYRHFKGNEYRVYGIGLHSETEEPMVIYQPLYGEGKIWLRPVSMWSEHVDKPNYQGPRFQYMGE